MSIKRKVEEVIACDYCQKELKNPKTWWRMVENHNFVSTDFCSQPCGIKYRDEHYYPSKYDPEEIRRTNSEQYNGG